MGQVSYNFENETVVITGAATGIGRGCAVAFATSRANVAVCDFNEEAGLETVELCKEAGAKAKFYKLDVTAEPSVIESVRDEIIADFGQIDILHSNAGVRQNDMGMPLENPPVEEWKRLYEVNYFGNIKTCLLFAAPMEKQKHGKIIVTSSISAYLPDGVLPLYGGSKAAIIHFAQSLSKRMGAFNVNVNVLNPGFVYTPIYSAEGGMDLREFVPALSDSPDRESAMNDLASGFSSLKRPQTSEDMANTVLFLCSEQAREITGQVINVDSGVITR